MEDEVVTAPAEETPVVEADTKPDTPEPEKSEDDTPKKAPSRREALEKAMKAVDDKEPPANDAKAAEEPDKPKAEAKPDEKPEPAKDEGQPRNADGTFKAKEAESVAEKPAEAEKAEPLKEGAAKAEGAPSRFSADAKAEWEKTPAPVRGEIGRAIRELESGIQQHQAALEPLKPYIDYAEQSGTTLDRALSNYLGIEQALRQDLRGGLTAIAGNMGMTLPQMIAQVTGENAPDDPTGQEVLGLRNHVNELMTQIHGLQQHIQAMREQAAGQTIDQFAASHPRFDELLPEMSKMIESGYAENLDDAYAKADRLNPAPPAPEPVVPTPAPPPQTRPARSVTGAPNAGSDPVSRKPSKSRREAIERAFNALSP